MPFVRYEPLKVLHRSTFLTKGIRGKMTQRSDRMPNLQSNSQPNHAAENLYLVEYKFIKMGLGL